MRTFILAGIVLATAYTPASAFAVEPSVAALPAYHTRPVALTAVPTAIGPAVELFNGKDLSDWDGWLGYADPGQTYRPDHATSLGEGGKGSMFSVVELDGASALRVDGATWGSLVHHGDYANYHLRVEYRFSGKRHAPRLDQPENNGLLYHSHGAPGAVWGTWMRAVEFEIMTGSTGMVVPVGNDIRATTTAAHDASLIDPQVRYSASGAAFTTVGNTALWNVEAGQNAEMPVGEWNVLDLYVVGDHAVHVVNGVPVMEVTGLCDGGAGGVCAPLTHGHVQLQSEGAETFFRRLTLEPIDRLPTLTSQ